MNKLFAEKLIKGLSLVVAMIIAMTMLLCAPFASAKALGNNLVIADKEAVLSDIDVVSQSKTKTKELIATGAKVEIESVGYNGILYVDIKNTGWTTAYIHYWGGNSTNWPGDAMTKVSGTIYSININATGFVVHNNSGKQTDDISFSGTSNLLTLNSDGKNGSWSTYTPPSTEKDYYLTGFINKADVTSVQSKYKFTKTSTNVYTLTLTFTGNEGGSQYVTIFDGSKAYHPATHSSGSGTAGTTENTSPGADPKWKVDATTNDAATFTWNSSTKVLTWTITPGKYIVSLDNSQTSKGTISSTSTLTGLTGTNIINLSAVAADGYYFSGWTATSGSEKVTFASSTSATTTATVTGACTIKANFTSLTSDYYIHGKFKSGGTDWLDTPHFVKNAGSTVGTMSYDLEAGKTYEFKVTDSSTWLGNNGTMTSTNCSNWTMSTSGGNCKITTTIAGTYIFSFDESTNKLSVTYPTPGTYTIEYNSDGHGTVSGVTEATAGSTVTVTVSNIATGYELDTLTFNGTDFKSTNSFTMPGSDVVVSATFKKINYTITKASGYNAHGTLTVASTANYGDSVSVSVSNNTGYTSVITVKDSSNNPITVTSGKFTMPASNVTVTVTYTAKTFTVTFDPTTGGSVTPTTKTVTYDSVFGDLPVPTKTDYTFKGWYNGTTLITSSSTVKITSNTILVAQYYNNPTITVEPYDTNGTKITSGVTVKNTVNNTNSIKVGYNSSTTTVFESTAGSDYVFIGYYRNIDATLALSTIDSSVATATVNGNKATFSKVKSDVTVYAIFSPLYTITINYENLSKLEVSTDGGSTYTEKVSGSIVKLPVNATIEVKATADEDYKLKSNSWSLSRTFGTLSLSDNNTVGNFTVGKGDNTITVTPSLKSYTGTGKWGTKLLTIDADATNIGDAWFAVQFSTSSAGADKFWVRCTKTTGNIYVCPIPDGYSYVKFFRMAKGAKAFSEDVSDSDSATVAWNKTTSFKAVSTDTKYKLAFVSGQTTQMSATAYN